MALGNGTLDTIDDEKKDEFWMVKSERGKAYAKWRRSWQSSMRTE